MSKQRPKKQVVKKPIQPPPKAPGWGIDQAKYDKARSPGGKGRKTF